MTTIEAQLDDIKIAYLELVKERDTMLKLIRDCNITPENEIRGKLSNYILEYDIPF